MIIIGIQVFFALLGLLMFALCVNPKLQKIGVPLERLKDPAKP